MSDAVQAVQAAAVAALSAHPVLAAQLSGIYDGPPPRAAFPYLAVTDGLVSDWSTKTQQGREVRLAFTIWDDGEAATRLADLMGHVDDALRAIPRDVPGWRIASLVFLRSFVVRDPAGPWAGLVEHRVRLLAV
ncbi:DUF3168 domain-containing protein [Sphingorhabdus wooponensis]|jgi:hypothetical protein|uniref:DUF3168 domain-containing protein n=1 Tax=Sphingorhabdus wooponensis TaxID=940136 RepID=A0A426RRV6_9SPHN|nr:DUF3168 domain-containing protein [Sphingorhabdus wooponensis]RRQ51671.1 DUF3168 domain-containing protein [Sphingorhabdus wooponensis]